MDIDENVFKPSHSTYNGIQEEQFVIESGDDGYNISSRDAVQHEDHYSEDEIYVTSTHEVNNVTEEDPLKINDENVPQLTSIISSEKNIIPVNSEITTSQNILNTNVNNTSENTTNPIIAPLCYNASYIHQCKICRTVFRSYTDLAQHLICNFKTHEKYIKPPFDCFICKSGFRSPLSLILHLQCHIREYICKKCNTKYPSYHLLLIHDKICHPKVQYKCKFCSYSFHSTDSYLQHLDTHLATYSNVIQNISIGNIINSTIERHSNELNQANGSQRKSILQDESNTINKERVENRQSAARAQVNQRDLQTELNRSHQSNEENRNVQRRASVIVRNNEHLTNNISSDNIWKIQNKLAVDISNEDNSKLRLHPKKQTNKISSAKTTPHRVETTSTNNLTGKFSIEDIIGRNRQNSTQNKCSDKITIAQNNNNVIHQRPLTFYRDTRYNNGIDITENQNSATEYKKNHNILDQNSNSALLKINIPGILSQTQISKEKNYLCHMCGKFNYKTLSSLYMHCRSHYKKESLTCHICQNIYTDENILADHVISHLPIVRCSNLINNTAQNYCVAPTNIACDKSSDSTSIDITSTHVDVNRKLICLICNKVYSNIHFFKKHVLSHEINICKYCKKCFYSYERLNSHLNCVHTDFKYECDLCLHKCETDSQLKDHKQHCFFNKNSYKCDVCNDVFLFECELLQHVVEHMLKKKSSCCICDEKFTLVSKYINHMYNHIIKNDLVLYKFKKLTLNIYSPIFCSICLVAFESIEKLTEHEKKHLPKIQKMRNKMYFRRKMILRAPRFQPNQNNARCFINVDKSECKLTSLQTKVTSSLNIREPSCLITNQQTSSCIDKKRKIINTDDTIRKSVRLESFSETLKEIIQTDALEKEQLDNTSDFISSNETRPVGTNENIDSSSSQSCLDESCDLSNSMKFEYTYEEIEIPVASPVDDHKQVEFTYEEIEIPVENPVSEEDIDSVKVVPFEQEEIEISVMSPVSICPSEETLTCKEIDNNYSSRQFKITTLRPSFIKIEGLGEEKQTSSISDNKSDNTSNIELEKSEDCKFVIKKELNSELSHCEKNVNLKELIDTSDIVDHSDSKQCNYSVVKSVVNNFKRKNQLNDDECEIKKSKIENNSRDSVYYMCPYCKLICTNLNNFVAHVGKEQTHNVFRYIVNKEVCSFRCSACSLSLPDLLSYNKHIFKHQSKNQFTCTRCDSQFPYICMLNRHQLCTNHWNNEKLWCSRCDLVFHNVFGLNEHANSYH